MTARSARLVPALAVIVLMLVPGVPVAHAGFYDVLACDAAGGPNNSWVPYVGNAVATTAYTECPTGGDGNRGIIARNIAAANSAASGNVVAQMKFTAAPGTTIIALSAAYDFYRADPQWEAALSTGSAVLRGCAIGGAIECEKSSPGEWIDVPGGSQVVYIDVYCATSGCPLGVGNAAHSYLTARARLASAAVRLQDDSAPAINSVSGGLWTDGWKSGTQGLAVDASDNSGIRRTVVLTDGQQYTKGARACDATLVVPCPNGTDAFSVATAGLSDGQHQLTVQAIDAAGNANSVARSVLVDNSPPGPPQKFAVDGGEGWRSRNAFDVHWVNPPAAGAPTVGAQWLLCPATGTIRCVAGGKDGSTVETLNALTVPKDGDWTLKLWLRDAAGNNTPNNAGDVVHLRVDTEPPTVVFSPVDPADPTRVELQASDATSGIASGTIDYKPHDAGDWTSLPAQVQSGRLVVNLPDETMADGLYDLRGHAIDRAGNERSTTTLSDGTPMTVTLPLRSPTHLLGGRLQTRHRHGRRVRYLATNVRLRYGQRTRLRGRLSDKDNKSMPANPIEVSELLDVPGTSWQPVRTISTDAGGGFRFRTARRGASRTVRIRYPGTPTVRPSQVQVHISVAASSTFRASRHRVRAGHAVRFSGTLRGGHVPAGKQVQLQVRVNGRWQVFATPHAKRDGRWTYVYKFTGRYRRAPYPFRAHIPSQADYPFRAGHSTTTTVRVDGK